MDLDIDLDLDLNLNLDPMDQDQVQVEVQEQKGGLSRSIHTESKGQALKVPRVKPVAYLSLS